jgi:hypothetical protein
MMEVFEIQVGEKSSEKVSLQVAAPSKTSLRLAILHEGHETFKNIELTKDHVVELQCYLDLFIRGELT